MSIKIHPDLCTSIDDLRSSLKCSYEQPTAENIAYLRELLAGCPPSKKTMHVMLTAWLAKLEKLSPRPPAAADSSSGQPPSESAPGQASNIPAGARRLETIGDLEVLPPISRAAKGQPMPLAEIEDHIRQIDAKIEDRTLGYHNEVIYDIAADGLMLLKVQAHYVLSNRIETVSTRRQKRNSKGQLAITEDSFVGWIRRTYCTGPFESEADADRFFKAKQRSIYNYMKLATNNGLTSDHSLEDVKALRTAMALHNRKPTEFYKGHLALEDAAPDQGNDKTPPPPSLVQQTQLALFDSLDATITLREDMDDEQYEASWTRLKATLEKFTGQTWAPVDSGSGPDGEHGHVHTAKTENAKAAKKAKAKNKVESKKGVTLDTKILAALRAAGDQGVTVKDLSQTLGGRQRLSMYKRLTVWFVTRGRNYSAIQKTAPSTYRLVEEGI